MAKKKLAEEGNIQCALVNNKIRWHNYIFYLLEQITWFWYMNCMTSVLVNAGNIYSSVSSLRFLIYGPFVYAMSCWQLIFTLVREVVHWFHIIQFLGERPWPKWLTSWVFCTENDQVLVKLSTNVYSDILFLLSDSSWIWLIWMNDIYSFLIRVSPCFTGM
jgi:hypothetical protein